MRIALLTIWHERNYGAEMQAYATIRALEELGHEVKLIDIRLSDISKPSLKGRIAKYIEPFTPAEKKFQLFWKQNIKTTVRYRSAIQLQANPPKADMYIVGSDQVWNPEIAKSLTPIFFLNFGGDNVIRASYASSFGTNQWNGSVELTELVRKQLGKFKAVSCREKTGCVLLKSDFNVESQNVLDPTLLHCNYEELIGVRECKNTLAFYPLAMDADLEEYTKSLSERLGLQWVNVNKKQYLLRNIVWQRNSIEEWISAIASASLVVTRSFHGLAFSIIYHRQFIVVNNTNRSSRLTDLLSSLGLEDRFFKTIEEVEKPGKALGTENRL